MQDTRRRLRAIFRGFIVALALGMTLAPQWARAQEPFLGEIRWVGFNFAPKGWATCDGQLMPISQNTALFSLLGTMYGGNGQTTFALPDMRGRVPLHSGQGPGLSPRDQGETGGLETVTLTTAEIPSHTHTLASHTHAIPALAVDVKASSNAAASADPTGNVLATATLDGGGTGNGRGNGRGNGGGSSLTNIYNSGPANVLLAAGSAMTEAGTTGGGSGTTTPTGGGGAHQNMQPFLGLNCIIALEGIFPPRN